MPINFNSRHFSTMRFKRNTKFFSFPFFFKLNLNVYICICIIFFFYHFVLFVIVLHIILITIKNLTTKGALYSLQYFMSLSTYKD